MLRNGEPDPSGDILVSWPVVHLAFFAAISYHLAASAQLELDAWIEVSRPFVACGTVEIKFVAHQYWLRRLCGDDGC